MGRAGSEIQSCECNLWQWLPAATCTAQHLCRMDDSSLPASLQLRCPVCPCQHPPCAPGLSCSVCHCPCCHSWRSTRQTGAQPGQGWQGGNICSAVGFLSQGRWMGGCADVPPLPCPAPVCHCGLGTQGLSKGGCSRALLAWPTTADQRASEAARAPLGLFSC